MGIRNKMRYPGQGSTDVSQRHFEITPSDTDEIPQPCRRLYVPTGGDITLVDLAGTEITWTVPDNFYIDGAWAKVMATGTDVTTIIGQS